MSRQVAALRAAVSTVLEFVLTREFVAVTALVGGGVSAFAGALICWGLGTALLVLAGLLIGLAILTGWE